MDIQSLYLTSVGKGMKYSYALLGTISYLLSFCDTHYCLFIDFVICKSLPHPWG